MSRDIEKTGPLGVTEPGGPPLPLHGQDERRIPASIGPFKILELVSSGMALVYKAEQENPQRLVALKLPRGGKLLSAESRERFLREVHLAATLDHSGIVPVLDAGEIEGTPYYTMPFIDGSALDEYVEREKPSLPEKLNLFCRLCIVVQTLHAQGLIHRDLKPANVLVDRHGDIRLLDFGLARALEEATDISADQALLGTLQYMAPEQTRSEGAKDLNTAADVYSLGMLLYWLLTGTQAYDVHGPREAALATIRDAVVEPPSARFRAILDEYDSLVLRALEKDPARRYRTAGDLLGAINAVMSGEDLSTPLTTRHARLTEFDYVAIIVLVASIVMAWVLIYQRRNEPIVPLLRMNPRGAPVLFSR